MAVTERTLDHPLPTEGAVPPVLEGLLLRIGPCPYGEEPAWPDGDGMVHAVELRGGRATAYRNRWVRTRRLAAEAGTPVPRGPAQPVDGAANVGVVWHAGLLLALDGVGLPHRLTTALETVGLEDFDGMLTSPMGPHPRIDPATGAMAFIGSDPFGPPFLRYHEVDAEGVLVHSTDVPTERATLHPDFGVTAGRVLFLELPLVHDRRAAPIPSAWDEGVPARVGVLDRGGDGARARWTGTEPCAVLHTVNTFDDGAEVVLDVLRRDRWSPEDPCAEEATLERWRIGAAGVARTPLDDLGVELPRVDPILVGRPYRFAYCTAPGDGSLVRYDLARDERAVWHPGPGRRAGEPVFVRDPEGHADDEGWVLSLVDEGVTTRLAVLDASAFGRADPDALVELPERVPCSPHGWWLAGGALGS